MSFERSHSILTTISLVLVIFLGSSLAAADDSALNVKENSANDHVLDGMKFKGPTGEKGKKTHHEDILSFENGKFTSSACFQYGFESGPYTTTVAHDSIHFEAQTISPTHGKMMWSGTVKGDAVDVDYSWTKKRWLWTTYREYWFKGRLVD